MCIRDRAEACENDPEVRELIEISRKIEGMPRHASTHAAGVVITPKPADEYVPLSTNEGAVVTQFTMNTIEELGLLKMDFLGLRTLTVISDAEQMVRREQPDFDMEAIPFDDPAVYDLLSSGDADGIFQLESSGMKQTLVGLKPRTLEDVIALISLYRPGPMDSIPKYIQNRHNPGNIRYSTEKLKPILDVTYGCIVYQEQVMQICRELGGFTYGQADLVRRAMSKKKHDIMEKERVRFVQGCTKNGIDGKVANDIFDDMSSFASYAFNKSHAAAYAVVAYQTAYLKCHHPRQFMAALMTSVLDYTPKVIAYISESERMGIHVLPPSINESRAGFTVQGQDIRYGLLALKNVGRHLIERVVNEREANGPYTSLYDFCARNQGTEINKRAVESFVKSGAFDGIELNRRSMFLSIEGILKSVENKRKLNLDGQIDLFGDGGTAARNEYQMPQVEEYPQDVLLQQEKEVSGLFLSGHPLEQYRAVIDKVANCTTGELLSEEGQSQDGRRVCLVCTIVKIKTYTTKSNEVMAFVTVEDLTGSMEVLLFPRLLMEANSVVKENSAVIVRGRVSIKEDEDPKILADGVTSVDDAEPNKIKVEAEDSRSGLYIRVPSKESEQFRRAGKLLSIFEGDWPVFIRFDDTQKMARAPSSMWTIHNNTLITELKTLLGENNVAVR